MRDKILDLAYDLCSINSCTYEEYEILLFLENFLIKAGLCVERLEVSPTRFNIFSYKTKKSFYNIIYNTHIDTVRPFIAPRIEKNILWGRGACDAKGIAAAMIYALHEQINSGFDDVALLLTVGEEEDSDGAKLASNYLKNTCNYLLVGEPTELKAAHAQKGSLVFDLKASGTEAHSALPNLGHSALHELVNILDRLINFPWPADKIYGETYLNIGLLKGGHQRNILAPYAYAQAIMRLARPSKEIIKIINNNLTKNISLEIKSCSEPFEYHPAPNYETFIAAFGSDAPYLQELGKTMLIGPGSLTLAHKENEHVGISDLVRGFEAYMHLADFARGK